MNSTSPHPSPDQTLQSDQQQQQRRRCPSKTLQKCKPGLFRWAARAMADPNSVCEGSLTPAGKRFFQERFVRFLQQFRTPHHLPYAAMIHRAISELNEKGGSSMESIFRFLKKEYHDLPLANCTILKRNLETLCGSGEIVVTGRQCYLITNEKSNVNHFTRPKKQNPKRKGWHHWKKASKRRKKHETTKENEGEGKVTMVEDQSNYNCKRNAVVVKKNQANEEQVEMDCLKGQVGALTNEAAEEVSEAIELEDRFVQSGTKLTVDQRVYKAQLNEELNVELFCPGMHQQADHCGLKTLISETDNLNALSKGQLNTEKSRKGHKLILPNEYENRDVCSGQILNLQQAEELITQDHRCLKTLTSEAENLTCLSEDQLNMEKSRKQNKSILPNEHVISDVDRNQTLVNFFNTEILGHAKVSYDLISQGHHRLNTFTSEAENLTALPETSHKEHKLILPIEYGIRDVDRDQTLDNLWQTTMKSSIDSHSQLHNTKDQGEFLNLENLVHAKHTDQLITKDVAVNLEQSEHQVFNPLNENRSMPDTSMVDVVLAGHKSQNEEGSSGEGRLEDSEGNQNQNEEEQTPDGQYTSKLKTIETVEDSLMSYYQNQHEKEHQRQHVQQPARQGCVRPPKAKALFLRRSPRSSCLEQQKEEAEKHLMNRREEEEQPKHRVRGRPPKVKNKVRGRPRKVA